MRVVHLYDGHENIHEGQGSLPRIVWNVARRTAERGHEVTVLERQWDGLPKAEEHENVRFRRISLGTGSSEPWKDVPYEMVKSRVGVAKLLVDRTNFGLKAFRPLREMEFDVLHVHLPFAANVLATIAPKLRPRMVFTAQLGELRLNALSDETEGASPDVPPAVQLFSPDVYLARRVAATTVLNAHVKRIFAQNGVPSERLTHIPNGVDVTKFSAVAPEECGRFREKFGLGDRPVVFFAGTVMPRKGVLELVQAAADVVESGYDDVRFVIAGEADLDREYYERVVSVVRERGIEENVLFTGYLRDGDLFPAYKTADVFVLPSFEEGFGMVVSEAMAAGTPPVASQINGIRQQVDDGETGFLVEPGSVEQLATALGVLLADPERCRRMGEESQRRARKFSWESVTEQYIDLYEDVTNGSAAPERTVRPPMHST